MKTSQELLVEGAGIGWRTIAGVVNNLESASPTWGQIASTRFYGARFDLFDRAHITYVAPADMVPRSPIYFNLNFITDGTEVTTSEFQLDIAHAKAHGQGVFNFTDEINEDLTLTPTGVQYLLHSLETPEYLLANLTEPNVIVHTRLSRTPNADSPTVENTDDVFLMNVSMNYLSNSRAPDYREPNFYER